jgi:2-polyprenyl-3-methyl-5-hydroxy-6-metoxy-1,4-benzoquinol methylase
MILKSKFVPYNLNGIQNNALSEVNNKISSGEYKLVPTICICGDENNYEIVTDSFYPNFINSSIKIVICKNCGTLRSNPYFNEDALVDYYSNHYRQLHNSIINYTEEQKESWAHFEGGQGVFYGCSAYNFLLPFVIEHKKQHNKEQVKVFEIGCGFGGNLLRFHSTGEAVYGCDYGQEGLEVAKSKGMKNMFVGGAEVLKPFGIPDVLIINHCLEHVVNLKELFQTVKDIVNNNTLIYIGVPNFVTGSYHFKMNVHRLFEISHVWHFSNSTLDVLMAKEGFEKIESNEIIQAVYKYTGVSKELSLFTEYNKTKIMLGIFDRLYTEKCQKELEIKQCQDNIVVEQAKTQQAEDRLSLEQLKAKQLEDQLYNKQRKYKKYRKYTKAISILYIATVVLGVSIILALLFR